MVFSFSRKKAWHTRDALLFSSSVFMLHSLFLCWFLLGFFVILSVPFLHLCVCVFASRSCIFFVGCCVFACACLGCSLLFLVLLVMYNCCCVVFLVLCLCFVAVAVLVVDVVSVCSAGARGML